MRYKHDMGTGKGRWMILLVIFGLVVGLGGVVREFKSRNWKGVGRFTIVRLYGEAVIESIDPVSREAIRLILPKDLIVPTGHGRGAWKLEVLPQLAEKYGWKWAGDAVADYLGITYTAVGPHMNSWDKLMWSRLSGSAIWRELSMNETAFVRERTEADDEKVLGLDNRWDTRVREYFVSSELALEFESINLVNTTDSPGIAARMARIIESSGVRVESLESNSQRSVVGCVFLVNDPKKLVKAITYLKDYFDCTVEKGSDINTEMLLGSEVTERFGLGF